MTVTVIVDFPADIPIRHSRFWIASTTGGTPRGLDGRSQVVTTENRYWIGEITLPPLTQAQAMRAQAVADDLRGRARILRLELPNLGTPVFNGNVRAFLRDQGVDDDASDIPFSDGTAFDDGAGFALPDWMEPEVIEGGAAGADKLRVDGFIGRNLAVGAFFSVQDYLYRVAANTDGRLRFNPVLREAVAVGTRLRVSRPRVLVQLADDEQFRLAVDYQRWSREAVFNVVEADR